MARKTAVFFRMEAGYSAELIRQSTSHPSHVRCEEVAESNKVEVKMEEEESWEAYEYWSTEVEGFKVGVGRTATKQLPSECPCCKRSPWQLASTLVELPAESEGPGAGLLRRRCVGVKPPRWVGVLLRALYIMPNSPAGKQRKDNSIR